MPRLLKINPQDYYKLDPGDACLYIGEYTAGGGYGASDTNQSIHNLKKRPNAPAIQLRHKERSITQWGNRLATYLNLAVVAAEVTLVPAPCSKPPNHPEHDDRILRVLQQVARNYREGGMDIRPVLYTHTARPAQHEGDRLTIAQIRETLAIDQAQLNVPLRRTVVIVDDVFTQGGTFKALQAELRALPGVEHIAGLFLAKTVWPATSTGDEEEPLF